MPFGGTSTGLERWRLKRPGRHLKDIVCTNWHVGGMEGSGGAACTVGSPQITRSPARPMGGSCRCPSCRDRRAWRLILNRFFFFNLRNCLFFLDKGFVTWWPTSRLRVIGERPLPHLPDPEHPVGAGALALRAPG